MFFLKKSFIIQISRELVILEQQMNTFGKKSFSNYDFHS